MSDLFNHDSWLIYLILIYDWFVDNCIYIYIYIYNAAAQVIIADDNGIWMNMY